MLLSEELSPKGEKKKTLVRDSDYAVLLQCISGILKSLPPDGGWWKRDTLIFPPLN